MVYCANSMNKLNTFTHSNKLGPITRTRHHPRVWQKREGFLNRRCISRFRVTWSLVSCATSWRWRTKRTGIKTRAKKQQAETQERENDYLDEAVLTFQANRGGRTDDPVDVDDDEEGEEDVLGASFDEEEDDGKKKGKRNKQKGGGSKKKPRRSSAASRNANAMAVNVHSPPPTMDMTQDEDDKFMERMVKLSSKVQQTQQLSQTPAPGAFNAAMAELRTAVRNGDITATEALQWKNRVRAEHSLPPMDK